MKRFIAIFLIIILMLSLISCTSEEKQTMDIAQRMIKKDYNFNTDTGKNFNSESAEFVMNGLWTVACTYKEYIEGSKHFDNYIELLESEIAVLKEWKILNTATAIEVIIYDDVIDCANLVLGLKKEKDKLDRMVKDRKRNVGNITEETLKKQEEKLESTEKDVENALNSFSEYFDF